MKTTTLIIILALLVQIDSNSQWAILKISGLDTMDCHRVDRECEDVEDIYFRDVCFINRDTGFIIGGYFDFHNAWGYVFKTTDGGDTWSISYESDYFCPTSIQIINNSTALFNCCGREMDGPQINRTTDSGESWTIKNLIEGELFFLNENTGYIRSWDRILKSVDGGLSWETVYISSGHIPSFYFLNEDMGWLLERDDHPSNSPFSVVKYTAPDSWEKIYGGEGQGFKKIYFVSELIGWFSAGYVNDEYEFRFRLFNTTDGGNIWSEIPGINYLIHDLYFENEQHGWSVGVDSLNHGAILETFDGGMTWDVVLDGLHGALNALNFRNGVGWAVGNKGLILKLSHHNFWIDKATIANNPPYLIPGKDTAFLKVDISNPENYPLEVNATIRSKYGTVEETVALSPDDNHTWNGSWPVAGLESFYTVNLLLIRTDSSGINYNHSMDKAFTTSGPLEVEDVYFVWQQINPNSDTIPDPGDKMLTTMRIRNKGFTDSIPAVTVQISPLTEQLIYPASNRLYAWNTIQPGESEEIEFFITIAIDAPQGSKLPFKVDLYSNDRLYWQDTAYITVHDPPNFLPEYAEKGVSIYPNPASDMITIEWPGKSQGIKSVTIYDMTGKPVAKKIIQETVQKSMDIPVSGLTKGIYMIQIKQENIVWIQKLFVN